MIDFFTVIVLVLGGLCFLRLLTGVELFSTLLTTPLEWITGYRALNQTEGVYNLLEAQEIAGKLRSYFQAITAVSVECDKYGWQTVAFEVVLEPDTDVGNCELLKAIGIEIRNFIQQYHGRRNDDIFVITLTKNLLVVQIACSLKAHELAQNLNFVVPAPSLNPKIEEDFGEGNRL